MIMIIQLSNQGQVMRKYLSGRVNFLTFQSQENHIPENAQAAASRNERRSIVASLVGAQAPLGFQGGGHAQL